MKDFKLPVELENQSDVDALICIVPAGAEAGHDLKGKYLTDEKFQAVAVRQADGTLGKPTEDHVILVTGPGISLEKIQRYIAFAPIAVLAVNVMSPNGEQLGVGFAQRTHDAVTLAGYEDMELPEKGDLILKPDAAGKHYAEHDFVSPFKSGPFDSLFYVIKAKTKVTLIIDAKYSAVTNSVAAPAPVPDEAPLIAPIL